MKMTLLLYSYAVSIIARALHEKCILLYYGPLLLTLRYLSVVGGDGNCVSLKVQNKVSILIWSDIDITGFLLYFKVYFGKL